MFIEPIVGGVMIGLGAALLLLSQGRVAGISGIASRVYEWPIPLWALLFLAGLGVGGALAYLITGKPAPGLGALDGASVVVYLVAGLVVGWGTRLGGGCTSGHGVCGMARFSMRSVVATLVFMAVGVVTATAIHGFGLLPVN